MPKEHSDNCKVQEDFKLMCDCDGYHTFNELYEHRIRLYIALCRVYATMNKQSKLLGLKPLTDSIWRSKKHSDGKICFGKDDIFIMGINKEKGEQITYHLPMEKWNETEFAETLDQAPEFDGHSSDDVLDRLKKL